MQPRTNPQAILLRVLACLLAIFIVLPPCNAVTAADIPTTPMAAGCSPCCAPTHAAPAAQSCCSLRSHPAQQLPPAACSQLPALEATLTFGITLLPSALTLPVIASAGNSPPPPLLHTILRI